MPVAILQRKISLLPENYVKEVSDFVDFLMSRSMKNQNEKVELAKSLIGSVPNEVSFEKSREERLSKI